MHVEAVRVPYCAAEIGMTSHADHHFLSCEQCGAQYRLYYDRDAAGALTHWSLLAQEVITARHPDHKDHVVLDWVESF